MRARESVRRDVKRRCVFASNVVSCMINFLFVSSFAFLCCVFILEFRDGLFSFRTVAHVGADVDTGLREYFHLWPVGICVLFSFAFVISPWSVFLFRSVPDAHAVDVVCVDGRMCCDVKCGCVVAPDVVSYE